MEAKKVEEEKSEGNPQKVQPLELPPPSVKAEERSVKHFEALNQLLINLEVEYKKTKARILEDLHNELAEVIVKHINEQHATIDTVLLTLEILKHEMITQKIQQLEKGIPVEKVL